MLNTQIYKEKYEASKSILESIRDDMNRPSDLNTNILDFEEDQERKEGVLEALNELIPAYKVMLNAYSRYVLKPGDEGYINDDKGVEPLQIITDMATFFKESAWTYETNENGEVTGWTNSKINYEGAFLYVIFFVQSLAFFIAYIRRFFYVVILALLAPAVILYDFFVKSMTL